MPFLRPLACGYQHRTKPGKREKRRIPAGSQGVGDKLHHPDAEHSYVSSDSNSVIQISFRSWPEKKNVSNVFRAFTILVVSSLGLRSGSNSNHKEQQPILVPIISAWEMAAHARCSKTVTLSISSADVLPTPLPSFEVLGILPSRTKLTCHATVSRYSVADIVNCNCFEITQLHDTLTLLIPLSAWCRGRDLATPPGGTARTSTSF
ncbi:hypothetical protein ABKN59_005100 [Abortiporus biennis]